MTSSQTTVLWLGLALVILNVLKNWSEVKQVVFGPPANARTQGSGSTGGNPSANTSVGPVLMSARSTPTNVMVQ